jgi:hypothetical protein
MPPSASVSGLLIWDESELYPTCGTVFASNPS